MCSVFNMCLIKSSSRQGATEGLKRAKMAGDSLDFFEKDGGYLEEKIVIRRVHGEGHSLKITE